VLARLKAIGSGDADYRNGKIGSLVCFLGEKHTVFLKEACGLCFSENAPNPMAFKILNRWGARAARTQ
jgi:hypothetical protein